MENKEYILSLIKLAKNKIEGRIKLQKLVYILKNYGVNFTEKFSYHHFGPYSSDLQLEIEELVDQGIVKERSFNPYIYAINEAYLDDVNDNNLKEKEYLINFLSGQDYRDLELVATIFYLKNNQYNDQKAIKNKLKILKPNLSNKVDSAYKLYETIDQEFS